MRIACLLFLTCFLVAGCGGDTPASDTPPVPTSTSTTSGRIGTTDLVIEVRETRSGPTREVHLVCPGDDERQRERCDYLDEHPALFEPVPGDMACTEIYGGDQTAKVTGTLNGSPIRTGFSRTNGCEIARYDEAEPLWRD